MPGEKLIFVLASSVRVERVEVVHALGVGDRLHLSACEPHRLHAIIEVDLDYRHVRSAGLSQGGPMDFDYKSPFDRRNENPQFQQPFEEGLHFFAPALTPLLGSEEVCAAVTASTHEELMVHQLYAYLNFTVRLELGPVNEVAELLSHRSFLPGLNPSRRGDAIYVVRDESKHAQWSRALMERVEEYTGIGPIDTEPDFLLKLEKMMDNEAGALADLIRLFFVMVSETLITGSLSRLPKEPTVQEAVRRVADAHASDERQHHTYFRSMFLEVWPTMPRHLRVHVGVQLPAMLRAFLSPDRTYMLAVLRQYADRIREPERVVDELMTSQATGDGMKEAAVQSIAMFRKAGVFSEPVVAATFVENGFDLQPAAEG